MGEWLAAAFRLMDKFPHGMDRFMGLALFATVALLVFVAVYAHWVRPAPAEDCEEPRD